MNKQELIEEFKKIGIYRLNIFGTEIKAIPTESAIDLIKQLDEPQKVKVPQFVADWIEYAKFEDYHLLGAMDAIATSGRKNLYEWFREDDNMDLFARAWLDGYEVEKEKRYIITLKSSGQKLYYHTEDEDYIFSSYDGVFYSEYHTKTDLEENGMSWVFDCPGIEIEEVE